jgi:hypothetical protein
MRKSTYNTNLGIKWINNTTLEDLDFADDLALLSENHQDAQEKTIRLHYFASQIGLQINSSKTKIMDLTIHLNQLI